MVEVLTTRLYGKLNKVKGFKLEYKKPENDLQNNLIGEMNYINGNGSFKYLLLEECCRCASMKEIDSKNVKRKDLSKIIKANEGLLSCMGYHKLIVETENEKVLDALEKRDFNFDSNPYKGEKILK